jgi:hypothetical protein
MSVYDERREELEKQEFMMGTERGRLAVTLDLLTDALVVGQHGVYCQSARQPGRRHECRRGTHECVCHICCSHTIRFKGFFLYWASAEADVFDMAGLV